ncbi:MAG: NAD(P)/FAD-dependent oxidoreductase [Candidatus Sericytochromatia bacterium]
MSSQSIAIIGGGAAGLTAATLLQSAHRVTLYEKADRLGGHAHTVTIAHGPDAGAAFDIGFMVLNDRNYPTFHRLLAHLGGIETRPSEMSFGYQSADGTTQYALNWRPGYADAGPGRPPDGKLLGEILRYFRHATRDLGSGALGAVSYGDYLAARGFSAAFIEGYALPTGAAIWSCAPRHLLRSPAAFVLRFYHHHGMLALDDGPAWQTVVGGSRRYVERIAETLQGRVVTQAPPLRVRRDEAGVTLTDAATGDATRYDRVILATHADEALAMLDDPSPEETRLLGAWRYQATRAVLHTDTRVMPTERGAWASWNYVQPRPQATETGPTVTYHLDRLQGHTGLQESYFLSLNPERAIDPARVHGEYAFDHPIYDAEAVESQSPLAALSGDRHTHYCGNYMGYGFHEDAVRSGADAARALGVAW